MEDFLNLILPFFAIIFLGYAFGRRKWIGAGSGTALNAFVFKVALPAFIFKILFSADAATLFNLPFALTHFLTGTALFVTVYLLYRRFAVDSPTAAYCAQATMEPNNGYLGVPLITALLGPVGGIAATVCLMVETMLFIPLAVIFASLGPAARQDWGREAERQSLGLTLLRVYRNLLTNPFVIATFLAVIASALQVELHPGMLKFIDLLAGATGPTALFAIGLSLAGRRLDDGLADAAVLSAAKLLIHPLLLAVSFLAIAPLLGYRADDTWIVAAVLVGALPVATHVFLFGEQAGAQVKFISGAILISSALGVATFPLVKAAIEWVLQS